jgi:four helix bundle protein
VKEQIESFTHLRVYEAACAMDYTVFVLTRDFPKDEKYALPDQLRRSSRSIGSNIAESWAKRRYKAHFFSKLTDVDGELQETKLWINRAEAYGYLPAETVVELISRRHSVGRMLGKMIENPTPFCRQPPPVSPPPRNL